MSIILDAIKAILHQKPKRPLTPEEKQAIDEQVIIIDQITRSGK